MKTQIISLQESNHALKKELQEQEKLLKKHEDLYDITINSISTQLDSAALYLSFFSIIIAITGVILGCYINHIYRKVIKASETNDKIKKDISDIDTMIKNDIHRLYQKMKREETTSFLNRLCKVPEDIGNIAPLLHARDLQNEDFQYLKTAYLNWATIRKQYERFGDIKPSLFYSYTHLMSQHFLYQVLKDPLLVTEFKSRFPKIIECSFIVDILRNMKDIAQYIRDERYSKNKKELINFVISSMENSQYQNFTDMYQELYAHLVSKEYKIELFRMLDKNQCFISKKNIGTMIIEEYSDTTLTNDEITFIKSGKKQPQ